MKFHFAKHDTKPFGRACGSRSVLIVGRIQVFFPRLDQTSNVFKQIKKSERDTFAEWGSHTLRVKSLSKRVWRR